MHYQAGMMRLWIALSTIWVIVILLVSLKVFLNILVGPETPEAGAVTLLLPEGACWAWHNADNPFAFYDDKFKNAGEARSLCWKLNIWPVYIMLGPPIVFLILGYVFGWVIAGFRK
jgi:hypothetical protein